jgi:hypothetical protein
MSSKQQNRTSSERSRDAGQLVGSSAHRSCQRGVFGVCRQKSCWLTFCPQISCPFPAKHRNDKYMVDGLGFASYGALVEARSSLSPHLDGRAEES